MKPLRIAFYGKGGIGKSTIACNVSALLGKKGLKVLHIGCDPKADSTRLLTDKKIPTVLHQFDKLDEVMRGDLVYEGKFGVQCVEAGGPEAGCGCAGLGIMTAMDELQRLEVFTESWDVIVYDVLGDVVCGGFSVPMRNHYVDMVFVVSSPSYMSLYAANNILKGIRHYCCANNALCGGIIGNHIHNSIEKNIVKSFAEEVKVPIVAILQEDEYISTTDYKRKLFALTEDDNSNAIVLDALVNNLMTRISAVCPSPLSAEELESFSIRVGNSL